MKKAFLVILTLLIAPPVFAQETTELGTVEVFEDIRINVPDTWFGYNFTVSPDEQWAVIHDGLEQMIKLMHIPSGQVWTYKDTQSRYEIQLYPNCFSQDSRRIFWGEMMATLTPEMSELVFAPISHPPDMESLEGFFLSFGGLGALRTAHGTFVNNWYGLSQHEGEFGHISWSSEGVLYETVSGSDNGVWEIRIGGTRRSIDYSKVSQFHKKKTSQSLDKLSKEHPEGAGLLTKMTEILLPKNGNHDYTLKSLSVSPDSRYLAGIVTQYSKGSIGFGGSIYGVLISLGEDTLTPIPFDQNVYGKMMWSDDSKRLYYYCQEAPGGGKGTICRLTMR